MKRHDFSASPLKIILNKGKRIVPITIFVTPAPRFPHPPAIPFDDPTTSFVNVKVDQNMHMTNDAPAKPMNVRRTISPLADSTNPTQEVHIAAIHKIITIGILGPYLSQIGPIAIRTMMVPPTPAIDELHNSFFVRLRVFLISGRSGETANQMKNATKKANHAE